MAEELHKTFWLMRLAYQSLVLLLGMPSPTGVADVFAFQNDNTVQAITSDGTTAWTADLSLAYGWWENVVPDFLGGLVALEMRGGQNFDRIVRFDGITGQPSVVYTAANSGIRP